jgi:hypothetical protein
MSTHIYETFMLRSANMTKYTTFNVMFSRSPGFLGVAQPYFTYIEEQHVVEFPS